MAKAILLVIDSFGIGAMEDCGEFSPSDCRANTYKHIRESVDLLEISTLYRLGLGALVDGKAAPANAYGFSALAHHGADTYLGHQEIAGSCPKRSNKRLMKDIHPDLAKALTEAGYQVEYPWEDRPVLLVNGACVIGDNLESSLGNIINLTADFNKMPFQELKEVGKVVRQNVDTSRVIAFGGPYTTIEHILSVVHEKNPGQWGVDAPKAKVYGKGYEVYHMGYGVNIDGQFPMIAARRGLKVHRIGKTADVLHGEGPADPIVDTEKVLRVLEKSYLEEKEDAAFLVNVQETDLAGHAEDAEWYARLLNTTDQWLAEFLPKMEEEDLIIIMADHGNDPTIGHSNHTREYVPILAAGKRVKPVNIGKRNSMADVGATISEFFGLPATEEGESFLEMIID
ncbi:phosphopentomutase [Cytobacillus oceanisediminis]|uniref:phosphopentomutase n=1 Tax=Cytobacillus oceanisediminis TaxID=665099 RepID=UPI0023DCCBBC|nr:phosphopentomutase [Cytobacillus oceanisediminis]MDF2037816.1 phosphopentomutase [Cytobacillus oceanisediminis]